MRILVTGSRDWTDWRALTDALIETGGSTMNPDVTVVHGGARGADMMADEIAETRGWLREPHPADWGRYGKAAGPIRNQEMVDAGADVCLAFYLPGLPCKGTSDCDRRAVKAGIPVTRIGVP